MQKRTFPSDQLRRLTRRYAAILAQLFYVDA
jgi:hypothetical protein